jgi:hypothetical protein
VAGEKFVSKIAILSSQQVQHPVMSKEAANGNSNSNSNSSAMILASGVSLFVVAAAASAWQRLKNGNPTPPAYVRPSLVQDALARNQTLYYFGMGSNMLRSKLENRAVNGSKIEIINMQPSFVHGYRLSFNLRGFAPLEPGMGSLEPVDSDCQSMLDFGRPECHGALLTLSPESYEMVMASEGVSTNGSGYEEIVVTAIPYDKNYPPVQAIALRARPHIRLSQDPCPSLRYMTILREGAQELQLEPAYQEFLAAHPVHIVPKWLKALAVRNYIATFSLSKLFSPNYSLTKLQNLLLFKVYVPSTSSQWRQACSHLASAAILLPGAMVGACIQLYYSKTGKPLPLFVRRFLHMLEEESEKEKRESAKVEANTENEKHESATAEATTVG